MSETSLSRASKLLKVLDLKQIEENLYQGQNETENGSRLFGVRCWLKRLLLLIARWTRCICIRFMRTFCGRVVWTFRFCTRLNGCGMVDRLRRAACSDSKGAGHF